MDIGLLVGPVTPSSCRGGSRADWLWTGVLDRLVDIGLPGPGRMVPEESLCVRGAGVLDRLVDIGLPGPCRMVPEESLCVWGAGRLALSRARSLAVERSTAAW